MVVISIHCEHFSHYNSLGTVRTAFHGEFETAKVISVKLDTRCSLLNLATIFSDPEDGILAVANYSKAPLSSL